MENSKMTQSKALAKAIQTLADLGYTEEVEKLVALKNSIDKKNGSKVDENGNKVLTKTQIENQKLANALLDAMEVGKAYTVATLMKFACVDGLSNQKVSSLLKDLRLAEKVERTEEKGTPKYTRVA